MNNVFDYIAEANVTASNQFHGDRIPSTYLQSILINAIFALKRLDEVKKTLFYGRELPALQSFHGVSLGCQHLPYSIDADNPQRGELLIHSIIGKATESGELLELLRATLFEGLPFDETNFIEEVGDGLWYDAIGLGALSATFEQAQRLNIAKLRHRFPQKFSEHDANNRDLFGERAILEGGPQQPSKEQAEMINRHAGRGLVIEVSGPTACGKTVSADMIRRLIPNATVIETDATPPIKAPSDLEQMAAKLGKQYATLENWIFAGNVMMGDVRNHPKLGDADGCTTSLIVKRDLEKGYCETKNTVYKLGRPYQQPQLAGVDTQA